MSKFYKRQDVIRFCDVTSSQLQSFERRKLIKAERTGSEKKPNVSYSEVEVIKILFLASLGDISSTKVIRKLLEAFELINVRASKRILYLNGEIFFVNPDLSDLGEKLKSKGVGFHKFWVFPSRFEIEDKLNTFLNE